MAPKTFTAFSDALVWIVQEFGAGPLFKYVNDFASAQPSGSGLCHRDLDAIQAACDLTGFESREEKRVGPCTCLEVLGVEVDSVACEMWIGKDKLQALSTDLQLWSRRQVASKREIASLHGCLSFVAQVAKPGQVFLHRIVDKMQKVHDIDDRITLSSDFLAKVQHVPYL